MDRSTEDPTRIFHGQVNYQARTDGKFSQNFLECILDLGLGPET